MFYFVKIPSWLQKLYPNYVWKKELLQQPTLYLTFDDGPNPIATTFVLEQLQQYNAKATFFCVGENVEKHNEIYHQIIEQKHSVGNHTQHHLNGWKTSVDAYLKDIELAEKNITSNLFRPPYGRIKNEQAKNIISCNYKIIMWSILSGDFDATITPKKCLDNVLQNADDGDIIVFHDSEKAFNNLQYVLPKVLQYFAGKGFKFESL